MAANTEKLENTQNTVKKAIELYNNIRNNCSEGQKSL
jgi:hypothetical protein